MRCRAMSTKESGLACEHMHAAIEPNTVRIRVWITERNYRCGNNVYGLPKLQTVCLTKSGQVTSSVIMLASTRTLSPASSPISSPISSPAAMKVDFTSKAKKRGSFISQNFCSQLSEINFTLGKFLTIHHCTPSSSTDAFLCVRTNE